MSYFVLVTSQLACNSESNWVDVVLVQWTPCSLEPQEDIYLRVDGTQRNFK